MGYQLKGEIHEYIEALTPDMMEKEFIAHFERLEALRTCTFIHNRTKKKRIQQKVIRQLEQFNAFFI